MRSISASSPKLRREAGGREIRFRGCPGKVIDYYRENLKKYGKVIECHTSKHGGDAHADVNDDRAFQRT